MQLTDSRVSTGAAAAENNASAWQELEFIGMAPKPQDPANDPQALDARNAARRKLLQAENKRELERDVEALKTKVEETEGLDMREVIQDKINAWFVENRHPETGEYPDFPDADEGGCEAMQPCASCRGVCRWFQKLA